MRLFNAGSNSANYENIKKNDWLVADETQQVNIKPKINKKL